MGFDKKEPSRELVEAVEAVNWRAAQKKRYVELPGPTATQKFSAHIMNPEGVSPGAAIENYKSEVGAIVQSEIGVEPPIEVDKIRNYYEKLGLNANSTVIFFEPNDDSLNVINAISGQEMATRLMIDAASAYDHTHDLVLVPLISTKDRDLFQTTARELAIATDEITTSYRIGEQGEIHFLTSQLGARKGRHTNLIHDGRAEFLAAHCRDFCGEVPNKGAVYKQGPNFSMQTDLLIPAKYLHAHEQKEIEGMATTNAGLAVELLIAYTPGILEDFLYYQNDPKFEYQFRRELETVAPGLAGRAYGPGSTRIYSEIMVELSHLFKPDKKLITVSSNFSSSLLGKKMEA